MAEPLPAQSLMEWMLLPSEMKFSVFEKEEGANFPSFRELWVVFPLAILVTFVRRVLVEGLIADRIARYFQLYDKPRVAPPPNPGLLLEYRKSPKRVSPHVLKKFADLGEPYVQRWWRRQRSFESPSNYIKFTECFWRFAFYSSMLVFGLVSLWDKPWLWDTEVYWIKNPLHHVPETSRWYYYIELSFYVSLLVSQFTDVRRKDFVEMFVHHVVTILLMVLSWSTNMIRIGTLVLLAHDFADIFLDLAKMTHYIGNDELANKLFPVFAVAFLLSRLILYPTHIVYSALVEINGFMQTNFLAFPGSFIFRMLLLALQILHIFWFRTILKMAFMFLKTGGQLTKDERSSDEGEDVDGNVFGPRHEPQHESPSGAVASPSHRRKGKK